ncbi:MAG: protein kinase [Alphaproteobacteria bacterium]|nr:protein kinase [Alphaproteobacteria bacterium]
MSTLQTGEVVGGRWRLEALLGEGALSQVWRVRHEELGNLAALKVLVLKRPRLAERLLLEGRIQAQLRHPHIVQVSDVVRHDGYVALVMDLVEGAPLDRHLATSGPLAVDDALGMLAAVCSAVVAAHEAGVLHRDLKPSNILLARQGAGYVPKVADFGIAKVVETSDEPGRTRVGAIMGTPGYLAPEQAVDASSADARCDVFALGVIAYELLAGVRAFDTDTLDVSNQPQPPRLDTLRGEIPAGVAQAVATAMAFEPDRRHPSVRAFAEALLADRPELLARLDATASGVSLTLGTDPGLRRTVTSTQVDPPPPESSSHRATAYVLLTLVAGGALSWALWPTPAPPVPAPAEPIAAQPTAVAAPVVSVADVAPGDAPPADPPPEPVEEPAVANAASAAAETPAPPRPAPPPPRPTDPTPPPPEPVEEEPAPPPVAPVQQPLAAAVEVTTPVAEPTATAPPEPPPPPPPPAVTGTWRGEANHLPLTLRIHDQRGTALRAEAVVRTGPTDRKYTLAGTISADGTLRLSEGDDGLDFRGTVEEGVATGTYTAPGARKPLPFSLRWERD